ncbi:MAG: transcriptional regulator [Subtercola sp.]|nr:transcriptional regulator [Subtercola sp.]
MLNNDVDEKRSTSQMSSVLRSFRVLEKVAELQPVSLSQLVADFGYSKSTVQRTLTTLESAGWIHQSSPDSPLWEVSARALAVRPRALTGTDLIARARGPMTELMNATDETIHLSILNGPTSVALIDRVDCTQSVRTFSPIGDISPLHATATGKAILAYLDPAEVELVVSGTLKGYSANTITQPERLRDELQLIRQQGYAVNNTEYRPTVSAIGAPIFDAASKPVASICISMPKTRFDPRQAERLGRLTRAAADLISLPNAF